MLKLPCPPPDTATQMNEAAVPCVHLRCTSRARMQHGCGGVAAACTMVLPADFALC